MTRQQLINQIFLKQSFLCIGLDTDIHLIPSFLLEFDDPILEFNKRIIDATQDLCVAYKPNSAFYEARGVNGWKSLVETWKYLPESCLRIIDAKRGDIGNTANRYAAAFFDEQSSGMSFDAITLSPYMGADSIEPFLAYSNKWAILLALTSNSGSKDFQFFGNDDSFLFEEVIKKTNDWVGDDRVMYVVGATWKDAFIDVRKIAPKHFLLVPGMGKQGGSLHEICKYGLNDDCGLIVNASRSILYASNGEDFAERAREEALKIQQQMAHELKKYKR